MKGQIWFCVESNERNWFAKKRKGVSLTYQEFASQSRRFRVLFSVQRYCDSGLCLRVRRDCRASSRLGKVVAKL